MNNKTFSLIGGIFFALVAVLHLLRIFYGWNAVIGGLAIPMWVSWVALVISAYLAYSGIRLSRNA